jgi:DNA transposition AAA+ family ATPase
VKILKSYYIESINLWIICVNADRFVDAKTKDAIRKQWRQQVHTAKDVVVIDQFIAPFEFIGKSSATIDTETVAKVIKQSELKCEHLSQILGQ